MPDFDNEEILDLDVVTEPETRQVEELIAACEREPALRNRVGRILRAHYLLESVSGAEPYTGPPAEIVAAFAHDPARLSPADRSRLRLALAVSPEVTASVESVRRFLATRSTPQGTEATKPVWQRVVAAIRASMDVWVPAFVAAGIGAVQLTRLRPRGPGDLSSPSSWLSLVAVLLAAIAVWRLVRRARARDARK